MAGLLLFYPTILCLMLQWKPSVEYWFGSWMLIVACVAPLWIMLCHFALVLGRLPRRFAPALVIILPALVVVLTCTKQAWVLQDVRYTLAAQDCDTFLQKADLERSWAAARDFKVDCLATMSEERGVSISELEEVEMVENCEGYKDFASDGGYTRDWKYLKALEERYWCGGWCEPQKPLWIPEEGTADSCSLAAARAIDGNIHTMSIQSTVYGGVILTGSTLLLTFYPGALGA